MTMVFDTYHAKIMLFGEYSIIFDSMGLSIPYPHFSAKLKFPGKKENAKDGHIIRSNNMLKEYIDHLGKLQNEKKLDCKFDLDKVNHDLKEGLYFESSIPEGYGLGSSGALVAAVYDAYSRNGIKPGKNITGEDISLLKQTFSQMESYFHGTSSGIDPL